MRSKNLYFRGSTLWMLGIGASVFTIVIGLVTAFYIANTAVMEEQMKDALRTSAALAADWFSGEELDQIQTVGDMDSELFASMVSRLQYIRDHVPHAAYVYIMRQTDDPMMVTFVADADALASPQVLDENGNGVVDADEEASYTGDFYDVSDVPALQGPAFRGAMTDTEIMYDQWGALISGYAPIRRDGDDSVAGTIGIDITADAFIAQSRRAFSPLIIAFVLVVAATISGIVVLYMYDRRAQMEKEIENEKVQLVRLASHQLGAPIATFRWWLEILTEDRKCKPGGACDQLKEAVERMTQVVENIRRVVDVQKRSRLTKMRKTSLKKALDAAIVSLATKRKRKKIHMKNMTTSLPSVRIDPKLLEGVLHEILDNALDYSKDKSAITIAARKKGHGIEISITDTGIGIPKKEQQKIFAKFHRGSNAEKMKPVGNGMGLWIANTTIEQAGGNINVESTPEKGSTFRMWLPVR